MAKEAIARERYLIEEKASVSGGVETSRDEAWIDGGEWIIRGEASVPVSRRSVSEGAPADEHRIFSESDDVTLVSWSFNFLLFDGEGGEKNDAIVLVFVVFDFINSDQFQ